MDLVSLPSRVLEYFGIDLQTQTFLAIMSMQPEFAMGELDSILARVAGSAAESTDIALGTDSISAMRRLQYVGEDASYHGRIGNAIKSAAPTNGQEVLDFSTQFNARTAARIGVDPQTGEIVVFRQHLPGRFHGYQVPWRLLNQEQKNALIRAGITDVSGRPIH
jgi:filamentous hemagglutinin